jgi:D-alanyl-lipoteichoic acid acyltransferase DltB (MBOAT superfamily)
MWMKIRNTFVIFIVSGFWHGANWTFIVWGALNAIYFLPLLLTKNNRNNLDVVAKGRLLPSIKEFASVLLTFGLTVFAWIFFRAENISHAFSYMTSIFSSSIFEMPHFTNSSRIQFECLITIFLIFVFLIVEWIGREGQHGIAFLSHKKSKTFRWSMYTIIILGIVVFSGSSQEFIYFQF